MTELTQYLIEHSCELLGENVLRPLGDTEEDNSGALTSAHILVAVNPNPFFIEMTLTV